MTVTSTMEVYRVNTLSCFGENNYFTTFIIFLFET